MMNMKNSFKAVCVGLPALLSACGHQPTVAPYPTAQSAWHAPSSTRGVVSGQRTSFDSVESYKNDVAEQIMRYNGAHTFSGALPPMLPAVVVLSITVDNSGKMTKVAVQRSRDNEASKVALASMQRAGPLPRPYNLVAGPGRFLTFSETFLFNADYRFQLRTLAGVQ
jgi:protein TonB